MQTWRGNKNNLKTLGGNRQGVVGVLRGLSPGGCLWLRSQTLNTELGGLTRKVGPVTLVLVFSIGA